MTSRHVCSIVRAALYAGITTTTFGRGRGRRHDVPPALPALPLIDLFERAARPLVRRVDAAAPMQQVALALPRTGPMRGEREAEVMIGGFQPGIWPESRRRKSAMASVHPTRRRQREAAVVERERRSPVGAGSLRCTRGARRS